MLSVSVQKRNQSKRNSSHCHIAFEKQYTPNNHMKCLFPPVNSLCCTLASSWLWININFYIVTSLTYKCNKLKKLSYFICQKIHHLKFSFFPWNVWELFQVLQQIFQPWICRSLLDGCLNFLSKNKRKIRHPSCKGRSQAQKTHGAAEWFFKTWTQS